MNIAKSKFVLPAIILAILVTVGLLFTMFNRSLVAKAAQSIFSPSDCYTAAATSTLTYQTPGNSTSTVDCELGYQGANSATLIVQINASNTSAVTKLYAEESFDNIDWYPIAPQQEASTSLPFQLDLRQFAQITFASSTAETGQLGASANENRLGVSGTDNRNSYIVNIPVRMRYVRVYAGNTGANQGIWMQILPRVEFN